MYLLGKLLAVAYFVRGHIAVQQRLVLFLFCDQEVRAVQRDAAVIADDPSPPVGVRQTGQNVRGACAAHFRRVGVEHPVIVRFAVLPEEGRHLRIHLIAVHLQGLLRHAQSAGHVHRAFEGDIGLKPHNLFQRLIQISRRVAVHAGDNPGVRIQHAAGSQLLCRQFGNLVPKRRCCRGRTRKKGAVPGVGGVVALNEIAGIDLTAAPFAGGEPAPCFFVHCLPLSGLPEFHAGSPIRICSARFTHAASGTGVSPSGYGMPSAAYFDFPRV